MIQSNALKKAEAILAELTPAEKTQLLKWVFSDLTNIHTGIEKTPGVCGGSARIIRTRIPVWLLVEAKKLDTSDAGLLQSYPTLNAEDLANAWAYYRANKEEIENEIKENEAVV